MFLQCDNGEFRAIQMIQDKTQSAGNGLVLVKVCNAGLGHLDSSLRARRKAVARGVADLDKDWAIACKARLVINYFPSR